MPKITLPTITSGYLSADKLNEAFETIAEAFENTLSRDGTTPNTMSADLDLNGYNILNSGSSSEDPERLATYAEVLETVTEHASGLIIVQSERQSATAGQTEFVLTSLVYEVGANNIAVYVDGVRKFLTHDYEETDSGTITFATPMAGTEKVDFVTNEYVATVAVDAHTHTWAQITNLPEYATRWPTWDEVASKPSSFTPATHEHAATEITSGRLADAQRAVYVQSTEPVGDIPTGALWVW